MPSAEVLAIAQRLRDNHYGWELTDRLHNGRWVEEGNYRQAYVQCTGVGYQNDCTWRSEGPPSAHADWDNDHLLQWNIHRVEMGFRDGVQF